MSAEQLTDLLPIPAGIETPNAYEVFGLAGGEKDAAKIKSAVKGVYAHLKAAKSETDPALWKQAAKMAESAKETLTDPQKRAELDGSLSSVENESISLTDEPADPSADGSSAGTAPIGVAPIGTAPTGAAPVANAQPVDPLAGMLPSADPLAGMLPGQSPTQSNPAAGVPATAFSPTPGQPNPASMPGQPLPGQPLPGQPLPGQQIPVHQVPGQLPRQQVPRQQVPGQQIPVQQVPVQHPAQQIPAQQVPGQQVPGQSIPGQPMPMQQVPGQPLPGQPMPGQPMVDQYGRPIAPMGQPQTPPPKRQPTGPVLKVKKTKRRKKSPIAKALFVLTACLLAAAIGGLVVFNVLGPDVSVRPDGSVGIGEQPAEASGQQPVREKQRKPIDPVMGEYAGDVPPPPRLSDTGLPVNQFTPMATQSDPDDAMRADYMPDANPNNVATSPMTQMSDSPMTEMPDVNPDGMMSVSPGSTSGPVEMSPADIAKVDQQIDVVTQMVRGADWANMESAAEKLLDLTLTDQQREKATGLYDLAQLATYYRGGIQRGLATLKATQDFDIGDGFRVLVVEVSSEELTIRYNARNKKYLFDELPFRLADKLATFSMDFEQPKVQAAMWAFHAVSPLTNADHRQQAIESLTALKQDIDEVDTGLVSKVIQKL